MANGARSPRRASPRYAQPVAMRRERIGFDAGATPAHYTMAFGSDADTLAAREMLAALEGGAAEAG